MTDIDIDKTAPVITLSSRSHPAGTWTNQDVNSSGPARTAPAAPASTPPPRPSRPPSATEGENQTTGTCVDNAGNSATDTATDIDIDKTAPVITLYSRSHPAGTWTNQDVELEWSCTDNTGGSGVDTAASTLTATVSTEGENQTSPAPAPTTPATPRPTR